MNVTLYFSIKRNCRSGVNGSVVMIRVAPYSVLRNRLARQLNRYNELVHSTTSLELQGMNRSAIEFRMMAWDIQAAVGIKTLLFNRAKINGLEFHFELI